MSKQIDADMCKGVAWEDTEELTDVLIDELMTRWGKWGHRREDLVEERKRGGRYYRRGDVICYFPRSK